MSATQSSEQIMYRGINITETINFMSIYIPNLPEDLMLNGYNVSNEVYLKYFFELQFPMGKVKRVDIATRPHHNGIHVRCAFVHFDQWYPFAEKLRMKLAAGEEHRLYGPNQYESFYSATNRGFERFISIKMNKAPIAEVSALDAEQMNVHQLVDNYKRLEKQLADKDAKIAELERYIKDLQNVCDYNAQKVQNLEFDLMASRCESGDLGDDLSDKGPMTIEELNADSQSISQISTNEDYTDDLNYEYKLVRLTPDNVSQYIGYEIMFRSRNTNVTTRILGVSDGLKTIKIDHPNLQNNLQIVSRKVYVILQ